MIPGVFFPGLPESINATKLAHNYSFAGLNVSRAILNLDLSPAILSESEKTSPVVHQSQEGKEGELKGSQHCRFYDQQTTVFGAELEPSQYPEIQRADVYRTATPEQDLTHTKNDSDKSSDGDQEINRSPILSIRYIGSQEDNDFKAIRKSNSASSISLGKVSKEPDSPRRSPNLVPTSRRGSFDLTPVSRRGSNRSERQFPKISSRNRPYFPGALYGGGGEDESDLDHENRAFFNNTGRRQTSGYRRYNSSRYWRRYESDLDEEEEKEKAAGRDSLTSHFNNDLETLQDNSPQRQEWLRRKEQGNVRNRWLDRLMSMVGIEDIKAQFLAILDRAEIAKRQKRQRELRNERFDAFFVGNLGTGKRIVAKLYAKFLASLDIVSSHKSVEILHRWRSETPDLPGDNPKVFIISSRELNDLLEKPKAHRIWRRGSLWGLLSHVDAKNWPQQGASWFGNVCTLASELSKILDRQARRLRLERTKRSWSQEDAGTKRLGRELESDFMLDSQRRKKGGDIGVITEYLFLTKRDILGLEPSEIRDQSIAWRELQQMVGLKDVKEAVDALYQLSCDNYQREIQDKKAIEINLNRIFLGPPGTGKSTVAKLYGEIIASLGFLSRGEVVVKETLTWEDSRYLREETRGKIFVIDNTHTLDRDIIYNIVTSIQNTPGDDRCVILIGWPDQFRETFEQLDRGFASRFNLNAAFRFQNYDDSQLGQILDLMLSRDGLTATEEARRAAIKVLSLERDQSNFGNGRAVENILNRAKIAHRRSFAGSTEDIVFGPLDFDPEYRKVSHATGSCAELFKGFIGFRKIIEQFQGYQNVAAKLQSRGMDPRNYMPFTFVFKGPPGTGKTVTARKLGQIYYDMGLLSNPEVVECSVSNLIGKHLGHTEANVVRILERSLGKVLFIDEAYRLAGSTNDSENNMYYEEAVGELVDSITKLQYARKMVIVLAGYDRDMDRLMDMNRGLRSRFPTEIIFPRLPPKARLRHFQQKLGEFEIQIMDDEGSSEKQKKILELFAKGLLDNGRDVETFAESISRHVVLNSMPDGDGDFPLSVTTDEIISFLLNIDRK
ncbi:hypothetical protein TWF696_007705 [Orbilia brochopaga]|uniref:AAA+ ATPase domain-containing protein n=1 Tax=Orbilia brochopaga TaxID=3140254 RepID=A0AAV9ULQ0_9PEZI